MRNLILIFLLFAASTAVAQSNQPFFAARAIMPDAPGDLGSDMYRVVLEISDQTGVYDGLDVRDDSTFFLITQPIAVGDDINLYPVLAIGPAYANIITVDVLDIDEAGPPNMGSQVLCEQSPDGLFAYVSGAGDPLNQAISDYNMKRVELELASRIDSLEEGLNVTFSGSGTNEDPLVINASGGGAGTDDQTAAEVSYDNSTSGLAATEVQTAIDLLENEIDAVSSGASDGVATGGTLDVANEEIDVVVASPGSNFSIDLDLLPTISGFAAWDKNAADDFDGAWSSLTGIPAGFADGVDNVNDADASSTNELQDLTWNNGTRQLTLSNGGGTVTITDEVNDADSDPANELQDISFNGTDLSISNGSTVDLSVLQTPAGTDDQTATEVPYDNSTSGLAATEVQTAIDLLEDEIDAVSSGASDGVATGGTLDVANEEIDVVVASPGSNFSIDLDLLPTISGFAAWDKNAADDFDGAWSSLTGIPAGFADGVDNVNDADASSTNELQDLTWNDGTRQLTLSNGGGTVTITDEVNDADSDPANEIQTINVDGSGDFISFSLSGSNTSNLSLFTSGNITGNGSQNSPLTGTDDQVALEVPYTPNGGPIAATNLQTAINEIQNDLYPKLREISAGPFNITLTNGTDHNSVYRIDMTNASTTNTVSLNETISPQQGPGYFRFHFTNTLGNTYNVNFPNRFLDLSGATWDGGSTYTVDSDILIYCYFNSTNFYCTTIDGGGGTDDQTAAEVSYDNSTSGLAATEVQTAIDLLENEIDAVSSGASDGVATGGTLDVANEEIDVVVASPGSNFSIDLDLLPTISGFAAWDKNTADDFDGAWSSLTGIPAGFADGVDARLTSGAVDLVNDQLFFSGFGAGFTVPLNTLDQLNVFNAWDKNAADDFDGAWSSLTGIPAGFADGVDNVGSGPTDEEVEDLVGPMFTTSTGHTRGFSFTYDDINSQIDLDHVGEHLQLLNFTPTYYTRVTDGIDFPFAVDLGSHLNGIDLMFEEVIPDAAFVSTTSTIDAGNESSHFQVVDMTGVSSKSLTFSNIPNGGAVILLFINADDTDTINWPSTVKWETGAGVATDFLSTGRRMIQLIHDGTDYWVPGGY
jgi:heptaprenylglyceryl phosphate synthase